VEHYLLASNAEASIRSGYRIKDEKTPDSSETLQVCSTL